VPSGSVKVTISLYLGNLTFADVRTFTISPLHLPFHSHSPR
jgi:hypothetical protein